MRDKKKKTNGKRAPNGKARKLMPVWMREIIGVALIGCSLFLFLSLASYTPNTDPGLFHKTQHAPAALKNLIGPVGSYTASFLKETMGLASYFVGALFLAAALLILWGKNVRMALWKIPLGLCILVCVASLSSLLLSGRPLPEQGGLVGHQVGMWLLHNLHPMGSYLLLIVMLCLCVIAIGETALVRHLIQIALELGRLSRECAVMLYRGTVKASRLLKDQAEKAVPVFSAMRRRLSERLASMRNRKEQKAFIHGTTTAKAAPPQPREPQGVQTAENIQPTLLPDTFSEAPKIVDTPPRDGGTSTSEDKPAKKTGKDRGPRQAILPFPGPLPLGYRPPPLELLDDPESTKIPIDEQGLLQGASALEQKLKDFGIEGKVTEIHPGPIITLFEYEPAPGIKVNRIVNLSDDLALAMKAMSVRIVAPIPGKAVVGIEVPNPSRQMVYLKEILASESFQRGKQKLPLVLGKDIAGRPFTTDLSRMPHLLIAGATGTGKSVCLHSLILSLVFRFAPQDLKFLMIDPKMLELSAYNGVPHLMHPVITESRRAHDALDWIVERMEQRYQLLAEKGVRNIEKYNEKMDQEPASFDPEKERRQEETSPDTQITEGADGPSLPEEGRLPYIIVVIDEMADLMIVSRNQVEESITRLAQMARAAGIHLLLATQRPSVDVLTGIIKANLPSRISFQVSSRTDSRTILDAIGAEKLLGQGDMLFLPPGTSKIRRIHGAFVTEPEIERVVEFLKQFGKPRYERIPFRAKKSAKDKEEIETFEEDDKYDLAVQLVTETRQASISMIQRKLRVGYNRAARMIERMEQQGIVGPQEGVKPREVLANHLE